jgi:hypothetical protein
MAFSTVDSSDISLRTGTPRLSQSIANIVRSSTYSGPVEGDRKFALEQLMAIGNSPKKAAAI